ncbi:MAG TPA: hypothetical protein VGR47_14650 [Terracidiphilus sp.]|nr:hypothetical protein [Terracidiphilus sp.]
MKTELAFGSFRIHFESRSRRRWFVALCYAVFALSDLVWCFLNPKMNPGAGTEEATGAWIVAGCIFFSLVLMLVLTGLSGDLRSRGDERETHRRQHSISRAYPFIGFGIMISGFASSFGIPTAGPLSPALREFLVQLTFILLMATFFLYVTLPQAILLWTEPDLESAQEQIN